jgi:hypothetical protein
MTDDTPEPEGILACIKDGDTRAIVWREYFGGLRVPIQSAEPIDTTLPNGQRMLCYFVDFDVAPDDWLWQRLVGVARRRNAVAVLAMLGRRLYPIAAEDVMVVRAPRRFLQECSPGQAEA